MNLDDSIVGLFSKKYQQSQQEFTYDQMEDCFFKGFEFNLIPSLVKEYTAWIHYKLF